MTGWVTTNIKKTYSSLCIYFGIVYLLSSLIVSNSFYFPYSLFQPYIPTIIYIQDSPFWYHNIHSFNKDLSFSHVQPLW